MARARRESRYAVDIWPGFVDALSTLLLGFIFLLVVFLLGQFFLNQLLQGKDTRLRSLEQAIGQLTSELDMEQASNAELRQSVTRLSSSLQAAIAERDDTAASLADTEAERDEFRDRVLTLEDQQAALTQTLNSLRAEAARLGDVESELERTVDVRDRLQRELEQAQQTVAADRDTIELQLAQLVQLRRDIEALTEVREKLDMQVAETTALLRAAEQAKTQAADELARLSNQLQAAQDAQGASEQRNAQLQAELDTAQQERGALDAELARLGALLLTSPSEGAARAARIEQLNAELKTAQEQSGDREQRLAALAAALETEKASGEKAAAAAEELQRAREQLLLELSQVRDRSAELETKLASEQERTTLAQAELEKRDLRIAELLRSGAKSEDELAIEQTLSREALDQVDVLNRQINALRVQLAGLEQALDLEQQKVDEQEVTIADLGGKLNLALAGKVEELGRFRSEFFGRLRQLLGERPDVRIVGDRFVFQSEVLFPTASAEIGPNGREELRKLAQSLREITAEMPTDIPWVLQVDGHTDKRPIRTPEFPSNWELSTARAINVGKFLVSEGIPPERIAVAGFGEFQPLDERDDEIAYRRNRRIEIKLTAP
ncbi:MAG TPA: peptidoglycan -binding protein [Geminicoccaceae bacterium]|nr:peptidoglycan -binding protein [Geminicoccaceae bacterium]